MTNEEIIVKARELGAAIQQSDDFAAYMVAKNAADDDAELQDLLGQFNLKKMDLNRFVSAEEKDPARIAEINQKVKELYDEIIHHPAMIAYSVAKDELDRTVGFVQQIILESAAGIDPNEIEQASCGGDCSACGGCH